VTHHTLRHIFATRCLQCGVPVATAAGWLGHKDNGALMLKVYSHLCDKHSQEQAAKVVFSKPEPENVVQLPKEKRV
jgi:integrase